MFDQALFKREETTLREIKSDPSYQGWFVKVTDDAGPFVIPKKMFFNQYSECDPWLDEEQTAYKNQSGDIVLLWTGYDCSPVVTLLSGEAAQGYLHSDTNVG